MWSAGCSFKPILDVATWCLRCTKKAMMPLAVLPGILILVLLLADTLHGQCTGRDKQALREAGFSEYKIDRLCGETEGRPEVTEDQRVRPKRPDTHGRLQELSNICQTPHLWCTLGQEGPPGTPCVCQSSFGPLKGVVVEK